MGYARWRHMVIESQRHALKAVDEWNCSTGNFGDFLTHMHKGWHYLLHAEFRKGGIDYHYKSIAGGYRMIDGEPKAWDLEWCLKQHYLNSGDIVRLNVEFFVALRNKVEHRYGHHLKIVTGGRAQALVMNYEQAVRSASILRCGNDSGCAPRRTPPAPTPPLGGTASTAKRSTPICRPTPG